MKRFLLVLALATVNASGQYPTGVIAANTGGSNYFSGSVCATTLYGDGSHLSNVSASLPAGLICMWSGLLSAIPSGWHLCDGTTGTPDLRDRFIKSTAAGIDPGGTGGSSTYTPAGTISQPTFTGTQGAVPAQTISGSTATESAHTHSVTAAGTVRITNSVTGLTVADHSYTPLGTNATPIVSWPAGVPTFAGTAVNTTNGTTAASGTATRIVPTNSTANTFTPAGTIAWPAGKPTIAAWTWTGTVATITHTITDNGHGHTNAFTGSAVTSGAGSAHSHTVGTLANSTVNFTPSGTVSQPTFTGTQATVEPAYFLLAFIMKL